MDYLHKTKRDYSIKIHHHHIKDDYPDIESKADQDIIELNDNVYIEFRLRRTNMLPRPAVEMTRRPFFRYVILAQYRILSLMQSLPGTLIQI